MWPKPYLAPPFRTPQALGDPSATTLDLPGYRQVRGYTCGYACTLMVLHYFGADVEGEELFRRLGTGRDGTRQNAIVRELRAGGVSVNLRYDVNFARLRTAVDRGKPIIAYHYPAEHWVVLYGYGVEPGRVYVADSRAGEPSLHMWDSYGPTLRGFGIICSDRRRSAAAGDTGRPAAKPETGQLSFGFFDFR